MMNLSTISRKANPVYVLALGVLGGAIPFIMYLWKFPTSTEKDAQQFVHAPSFLTWIFLLSMLFSVITIILIPGWQLFRQLYTSVIRNNNPWNVVGVLVISAAIYLGVIYVLSLLTGRVIDLPKDDFARELYIRFVLVYIYTIVGLFQVIFSIILINYMAEIMSNRIVSTKDYKTELLVFIQEYLDYRNLLQVCLITTGILLSLNTIITSAFFLTWKEIGALTADSFPSQIIVIYGLIYTLLIMLTYVPTYFALMNVGRELRDAKYPLDIDTLEVTMKNRKMFDDLLQINFGIAENLKKGIFILTPLISGLLASLLGFK